MNKAKIIFLIIILGFVGIVIFQNKDFFMAEQSLVINLYFAEYTIPETAIIILFLVCFFVGLFIGYLYYLFMRLKSKKMIRNLNSTINSHLETISDLEKDVESIKRSFTEVTNDDVKESLNKAHGS